MNIDTKILLDYITEQEKVVCMMPKGEFFDGVLEGYKLVKTFLLLYQEKMGAEMAEALDGNKS